jgi:uncharacterized protein (TIGR03435 family)
LKVKKRIEPIMKNRIGAAWDLTGRNPLEVAKTAALRSLAVVVMISASALQAQPANTVQPSSATGPRFELASVKPCGTDTAFVGGGRTSSPGSLVLNCQTVRDLIRRAYLMYRDGRPNPDPFYLEPISGGPGWVDSDKYTINARAEIPQSQGMMAGPMLQALLEDRFRLSIHREKKEVRLYELTVAKGGPKLQVTNEGSCIPFDPAQPPAPPTPGQRASCGIIAADPKGGVIAHGLTMAGLCRQLSATLGQYVIDKTGLAGAFDIHLDLSRSDLVPSTYGLQAQVDDGAASAPPSDPVSAVTSAIRKLGLQLVSTKGPGEILVIDRVERPSEN